MKIEIQGSVQDDFATEARLAVRIDGRLVSSIIHCAPSAAEAMTSALATAIRAIAIHEERRAARARRRR